MGGYNVKLDRINTYAKRDSDYCVILITVTPILLLCLSIHSKTEKDTERILTAQHDYTELNAGIYRCHSQPVCQLGAGRRPAAGSGGGR